jgi:3-oxoacyl-[acyl-carrier protein] reductase
MEIRFDNRSVLVTGGSTGIGAATAIEFGRAGASVVVNYLNSEEAAREVVRTIKGENGRAVAVRADVSKKEQVDRLIAETIENYGAIDILVNNAGGLIKRCLLEEMTDPVWDTVLDVNLRSVYLCSQAVVPIMKKNNSGRIINLSSIAARTGGGPGAGFYAATKAAISALTKNFAKELVDFGITVNAVAPGIITTPFHDRYTPPDVRRNFLKSIPLKREGTAEEIAYTILFLASDYADYIIGETIEINGGMLMD